MTRHLFVMISRTNTGFGKKLQKFGNIKYNHASISLDEDETAFYSFSRTREHSGFLDGCQLETVSRYCETGSVPVMIFKIPVSDDQYTNAKEFIAEIRADKSYKYNLISVVTQPIFGGFRIYKAYSCIEFVLTVLAKINVFKPEKKLQSYVPDELPALFNPYVYYDGLLNDYVDEYEHDDDYFESSRLRSIPNTIYMFSIVAKRSVAAIPRNVRNAFRSTLASRQA